MSIDYLTLRRFDDKLDQILTLLQELTRKGEAMSAELDALTASVKANTDAEQSAILLLGQLGDLIRASANDPAALRKLASDLDISKAALASAVLQNTPAAPTP